MPANRKTRPVVVILRGTVKTKIGTRMMVKDEEIGR
jgi:hypothetical protein